MVRRCENCEFYDRLLPNSGMCRRNSPRVVPGNENVWPSVHRSDWCGEFKPREVIYAKEG